MTPVHSSRALGSGQGKWPHFVPKLLEKECMEVRFLRIYVDSTFIFDGHLGVEFCIENHFPLDFWKRP